MSDDGFGDIAGDERVRALVQAQYHAPNGEVPREAIWAAVRAARRGPHATPAAVRTIRPLPRRGWPAALAAGLVLGIALDRTVAGPRDAGDAPATRVAHVAPRIVAPPAAATHDTGHGAAGMSAGVQGAPAIATIAPPGTRVASAPIRRAPAEATPSPMPDSRAVYEAAAVQTLVQAEALLTAYRRAEPAPQDDEALRQTARWSREVLSSTRLLLDSPAGGDPRLRGLLRDLELVLAQIVQLSGEPLRPSERELIERAMHERDLLPRLRSAVPAGAATT